MSHVIKANFRTGPKYWTGEAADNWTAYITGAKKMNQATARLKINLWRELCGPTAPQFEAVEIDDRNPIDPANDFTVIMCFEWVTMEEKDFVECLDFAKRSGYSRRVVFEEHDPETNGITRSMLNGGQ